MRRQGRPFGCARRDDARRLRAAAARCPPGGAKRSFLNDTVSFLRGKKDEAEYALLKMNAVLNDGAMKAGFAALKDGVTELEVGQAIRDFYARNAPWVSSSASASAKTEPSPPPHRQPQA
ncbi:hypothetical protein GCM10023067_47910 [Aminobacter aganoensis]|uniref:hypothetical protein n=1 Tax=Aminobacter aganoensis TaxID=83264 RepID=UPI0031E8F967